MNTINTQYNNTNFGMRYKNPEKWGRKTLQTFMDSQLKKDIDAKYPNAIASYKVKTKRESALFERKEYCHRLTFDLQLEKGKIWQHTESTLDTKDLLDDVFSKKIDQLSLQTIEDDIQKEINTKNKHLEYIKKAKKENKTNNPTTLKKIIDMLFGESKRI